MDPDETETRILGHDDHAPLDALVVQGRDIGTGLRGQGPQVRRHPFQIEGAEFALEEVVETHCIGQAGARPARMGGRMGNGVFKLGQVIQRCG